MANDGKLRIETELDQNGFKSGLQKLSDAVKAKSASIQKSFSDISKSAKLEFDISNYAKGAKSIVGYNKSIRKELNDVNTQVAKLSQQYRESVIQTGKYSKESEDLADKLSTLKSRQSELRDEIEKSNSSMQKYAINLSGIGNTIKSGLTAAAKTAAVAIATTAAGVATLSTLSITAYSDYEQLVGGVETLFGAGGQSIEEYADSVGKSVDNIREEYEILMKSQQTVINNADAAYQTAGLSANKYMETVTSFSASLLQGLEGDTQLAAEIANKAIVDMADNANKMGTDMTLIQNAYQGFAKQNYTMLDNLKLGYGGTQAEMARLINESGVLGDTMEVTAETVNQVSFDKIIKAIHVVQEDLGITGTTAEEASSTIQGSVSSMKAAWENLMVALSAEDWDVDVYVENFVDTVITVVKNVAPRIKQVLPNIANAIGSIVDGLGPYISESIKELLPVLINGAISIAVGIAENIPEIFSVVTEAIIKVFSDALESAPDEVREKIQGLIDIFNALLPVITGITTAIVVFKTAMTIGSVIQTVTSAISAFKAANDAATISQAALNAVMNLNPFVLIATLIAGVVVALITLWNTNEEFRTAVIEIWGNVKEFILDVVNSIVEFFTVTIPGAFNAFIGWVSQNWPSLLLLIVNPFAGAFKILYDNFEGFRNFVDGFFGTIKDTLFNLGNSIVTTIKDGIAAAWQGLTEWFNNLWNGLFGNRSVDVNVNASSSGVNGSHANGLSRVPFDGYIAELHEGEMVLTKSQANSIRKILKSGISGMGSANPMVASYGTSGGTVNNTNITINGDVTDPDVMARRIRIEQRYGLAGAR